MKRPPTWREVYEEAKKDLIESQERLPEGVLPSQWQQRSCSEEYLKENGIVIKGAFPGMEPIRVYQQDNGAGAAIFPKGNLGETRGSTIIAKGLMTGKDYKMSPWCSEEYHYGGREPQMIVVPYVASAHANMVTLYCHYREAATIDVTWAVMCPKENNCTCVSQKLSKVLTDHYKKAISPMMRDLANAERYKVDSRQFTFVPLKVTIFEVENSQQGVAQQTKTDKKEAKLKDHVFLNDVDVYQTAPPVHVDAFFHKNRAGQSMLSASAHPVLKHFFDGMNGDGHQWMP